MRLRDRWVTGLLAAGLAACTPVTIDRDISQPAGGPGIPDGAIVYRVTKAESELRVLVYREGALASLGHNHVISSRALTGIVAVADDPAGSVVQLELPVDSLEVDRPELRDAEGDDFPGHLDATAIDGTRANLLGEKLLDAVQFPAITVRSRTIEGRFPDLLVHADIGVRGHVGAVTIPVHVRRSARQLVAEGSFDLSHTQLGLEPFSVMLGALAVRDTMHVKFRVVARPAPAAGAP